MNQDYEQNKGVDIFSDEISILDLWNVVTESFKPIIFITVLCFLISIVYALILPPVYKVNLSMIASEAPSVNSIQPTGGALGSFASLAGINMPLSTDSVETHLAIMQSRVFLEGFLERNNVVPVLYKDEWDSELGEWKAEVPKMWSVVNSYRSLISINRDSNSGIINLSIEWSDPEIAAFWANQLVVEINDYLKDEVINEGKLNLGYLEEQLKKTNLAGLEAVIFSLMSDQTKDIMLANVSKDYAFKVLDPAVIPLERISPRRKVIAILGFLVGIISGLIYTFSRSFYINMRAVDSLRN